MNDGLIFTLILLTTLGCALNAGLFFAFSTSVMKALGSRPPAEGMAAMRAINIVIINPIFMLVFFGSAVGSAAVMVMALIRWQEPGALLLLLGGAAHLFGSFGVTLVCNVPRNNALEKADPAAPGSEQLWADYLRQWTAWNHVRTIASVAAVTLLTMVCPFR